VVSSSEFEVNGVPVELEGRTDVQFKLAYPKRPGAVIDPKIRLGEAVTIFGKREKADSAVIAKQAVFTCFQPRSVLVSAVIDAILPSVAGVAAGDVAIRADGYTVLIGSKTARTALAPLGADEPVRTSLWVRFEGVLRGDGVVVADSIELSPNTRSEHETSMRRRWEYEPAGVAADAKQSGGSRNYSGMNYKLIPTDADTALQARVKAIGEKLVPAYLRAMRPDDPGSINLRFAVVDSSSLRDALGLPSGVVLVPHHLVVRLENDSQIAALLAAEIAFVIERQGKVDLINPDWKRQLKWDSVGGAIPGGYLAVGAVQERQLWGLIEQSDRVSLGLMRDAGYDLDEAPKMRRLLSSVIALLFDPTPMSPRAAYLYQILGTVWQQ